MWVSQSSSLENLQEAPTLNSDLGTVLMLQCPGHRHLCEQTDPPNQETYPVELLLEFLIGIVDTELLKTISVESLKPTNKKRLLKLFHNVAKKSTKQLAYP